MILDTDNKPKSFLLFFLVFISSTLIIWQYFKLNPWQTINNEDSNLNLVTKNIGETFLEIGDSWSLAKDFTLDSQDDLEKELNRQKLLEETKKYLESKKEDVVNSLENN
tara:strand:+ start:94 stop:420 length:327 start_codon:yes stop_codon:yes gene_type:complete